MFYEFRFKNNSLSTSQLASTAFSFKTLPMSNSHWQSVGARIQPVLRVVGGTCCHTMFSLSSLCTTHLKKHVEMLFRLKSKGENKALNRCLVVPEFWRHHLNLQTSLVGLLCKKKERGISQAVLSLSSIQLSTDLKCEVSLLGLGHNVSISPWASSGGGHLGVLLQKQSVLLSLFDHLCSLLL